jgi:hypothetical protein
LWDADRQGHKLRAVVSRIGQGISGVVYAALGFSVFELVDALGDLRQLDERGEAQAALSKTLATPGGELAVLTVGLFVIGVGVGNVIQAMRKDFCEDLACDSFVGRWAQRLGKLGYLSRGVAFILAGLVLVRAGLHVRGGSEPGLGPALDALRAQPSGDLLLALVGTGLIAFGLFALVEARYRRMRLDR